MKWIQFHHLYQPPSQDETVVKTVSRESYDRICALHEEYPHLKSTINLSGSLIELLEQYKETVILSRIKKLVESSQIELVGSVMYHPLMPKISIEEASRQITFQEEALKRVFGDVKLRGFYFPEMAYDANMAVLIKERGYEWIILDEIHSKESVSPETPYKDAASGLKVVFRDRTTSKTFPPQYVTENFSQFKNKTVIIAHDGELYGHWHKDDMGFYSHILTNKEIAFQLISEYIDSMRDKKVEPLVLRPASWESTEEELALGIPYSLWDHPDSIVRKSLWAFATSVGNVLEKKTKDPHIGDARREYSKGLASCAWWWASERRLGPFSPLTWNPTEIEKGVKRINNAARTLKKLPVKTHAAIEHEYHALLEMVWNEHWKRFGKENGEINDEITDNEEA
ncbi:MAG TPA: hypothetical protein PLF31_00040 [Candidatus Paceibacterota bacterium]|nr:hypothetical protein [Candidatus Paceibacterota bacterium]